VDHPQDIPEDHLHFLENLPLMQVTDEFIFAHAGINTLDDPYSAKGRIRMLYDRSEVINIDKLGGRRVVSGHTTRKLEDIMASLNKNHLRIDNGVYLAGSPGKGNLIALDLGTNQLWVQPNIDMAPVV
jgi:serine/threonine protein phosphatase 1